jgi:type I restriction enzyme, S subunit
MKLIPKKLKYIADHIARGDAPSYVDESDVLAINQACVSPRGLAVEKGKFQDPDDTTRIGAWLHPGDVLINSTGTGTLGRVGYVNEGLPKRCFADGHVTIIRDSKGRFVPRFLFYLLSIQQEQLTVECAEGATNQIELSRHNLGNKVIDWPSIEEQRRIAALLDVEVARLDQLVDGKQRLLNLLTEKRRSLIANAVTRGLNAEAPTHESGVEWLGHIPSHWTTENTRWLFKEIDDRSEDGTEELLTVSHLTGVTKRSEKDVNMFLAESNEGYKRCRAGDLVINTLWAWMGAMGVSRHDGIVSPAYNVYRPTQAFDPDYLDHLVRTPLFVAEITRYSKGVWSSRMRLYPEGLYEASMPVPPLAEQSEIVRSISMQVQRMDALSQATRTTVALLEERRTALIAQAITGVPHDAN